MKNGLLITGDFFIEANTAVPTREDLFGNFLHVINNSEIAVTNFEGPVNVPNFPLEKTGPTLRANPSSINVLRDAGFTAATLATNHIMDLGSAGLSATLEAMRENGMVGVGAGKDLATARAPFLCICSDRKIAILNFSENEFSTSTGNHPGANPLDPVMNMTDIKNAKEQADFVVVIVHGGHEGYRYPSPRMKSLYRFFVEAGAHAVMGHHTHCISGFEVYKGAPIFYSLGNFVFDWHGKKGTDWYLGIAVKLFFVPSLKFEIIPFTQFKQGIGITLLDEGARSKFDADVQAMNQTIANDDVLESEFDTFCTRVGKTYMAYIEPHSNRLLHAFRNRGWFPSMLSKKKKRLLLNLMRCESHRDVLLKLLQK